jgi:hypothetical protein
MTDDQTEPQTTRQRLTNAVLHRAIGIVLGHQVAGGDADEKGIDYYQDWIARQEGQR